MKRINGSIWGWRNASVLLLAGALALVGCGGSGTSSGQQGQLLLGLTDAEGDFLSYTVDVTAIQLEKANGAAVAALPVTTTVDFAQYVELTELLTAATVPSGIYVSADITLDFTDASIIVQDEFGNPIEASVEDSAGDPIDQLTVSLDLNGDSSFRIAPGIPAVVTLDFDLDASNEIEITGDTAVVTVSPVLVVSAAIEDSESFRLRGLLGAVDAGASGFQLILRPFRHRSGRFGDLRVNVDAQTVYEVDGIAYQGAAGLAALAALDTSEPVITYGEFSTEIRQYTAGQVYAGSSVPWSDQDIVRGSTLSRDGDTLVVHGVTVQLTDGTFVFRDTVEITLGPQTTVTRQGDGTGSYGIGDLSIGQAVTVLGELTADSTLDATLGHVRMRYSTLTGTVAAASPLVVDLQRINARRVSIYDFTGTGIDATNDADPEGYEVFTGTLPLAGLELDDPVRVRGFTRPFGTAPEDFDATTIIDVSELPAALAVGYGPDGSTMAVASLSQSGIQLDITDAGKIQQLVQAGITTELASLPAVPLIVPPASDRGLYALAQGRRVEVYTRYDRFVDALAADLAGGAAVRAVLARGDYDAGGATLTSGNIRIRLVP